MIATILALVTTEDEPFDAVLLRDHVVLGSRDGEDRFYEILDVGRVLEGNELRQYPRPPGGPERVRGREFLPYYIDNLAARLAAEGDLNRAEALFVDALRLAPKAARIRYNYGTFLLERNRPGDAVRELSQAIDLGWIDADAYANRGAAYWRAGQLEEARTDLEHALALDPTHATALSSLQRIDRLQPAKRQSADR